MPGVRLKALEGSKQYAADSVRSGRPSQTFYLKDDNAGVRVQAIDLLTRQSRLSSIVGVLQDVTAEGKARQLHPHAPPLPLQAMKASVGTY